MLQYKKLPDDGFYSFYWNGKKITNKEGAYYFNRMASSFNKKEESARQVIAGLNYENAKLQQRIDELEHEIRQVCAGLKYAELRLQREIEKGAK